MRGEVFQDESVLYHWKCGKNNNGECKRPKTTPKLSSTLPDWERKASLFVMTLCHQGIPHPSDTHYHRSSTQSSTSAPSTSPPQPAPHQPSAATPPLSSAPVSASSISPSPSARSPQSTSSQLAAISTLLRSSTISAGTLSPPQTRSRFYYSQPSYSLARFWKEASSTRDGATGSKDRTCTKP